MIKLKSIFSTPKKALISVLSFTAALTLFGLGIFVGASTSAKEPQSSKPSNPPAITDSMGGQKSQTLPGSPQDSSSQISLDSAKETALSDAGVSSSDVTYTKAELDYEDGVPVYEIKFYTTNCEFEYEINASTGAIRSQDKEWHDIHHSSGNSGSSGSDIGVDKAKSIAAGHAGFSLDDVVFSKAKFEKDRGSMTYEIEFYKDGMEYEYEIDASTGEILEFDTELDD